MEGRPFHAVISIESLGASPEDDRSPRLAEILGQEWRDRQIILACYDVMGPEYGVPMPDRQIVYDAIAHAEKWRPEEGECRLLIHCHQGVSRSPAIALVLMRYFRGPGTEQRCLDDLLILRPPAMPNTTIIERGNEILGCDGELIRVFQEDPRLAEGHEKRLLARQRRLAEGEATI